MDREKATNKLFAIRLREARIRSCITQRELGVQAGIDESSASPRINQYEKGKHTPAFEIAVNLAKALNIPVAYFYTLEDDLAHLMLTYSALPQSKKDQAIFCVEKLLSN